MGAVSQVPLQPFQYSLLKIAQVFAFEYAVRFAWIDNELDGNIAFAQGAIESVRLVNGYILVNFAVNNQRRCLHARCIGDGGVCPVEFRLVERVPAQEAHIPVVDARLRVEAVEVTDASDHNGCFETMRLRHRPGCHETAVAATYNCYPLAVHHTLLNQVIDAMQDVLEIFATHIADHRIRKGDSPAPATAYIRSQNGVPRRSE